MSVETDKKNHSPFTYTVEGVHIVRKAEEMHDSVISTIDHNELLEFIRDLDAQLWRYRHWALTYSKKLDTINELSGQIIELSAE